MMTTMIMMTTMSIVFPWLKHPLSMGMILILQTISIALITGMMFNSFWFSYLIFIILLGSALVLFIYMASIASNEKMKFSLNMTLSIMLMTTSMMTMSLIYNKINYESTLSIKAQKFMENEQTMTLIKLFNMKSMSLTIMMITYLLITMIIITHITNIHEGPMRMKI
uniref:NADH-ubiquinone oxidoreductase chain 6 n=1 Tax=Ochterus marginatus TaxID=280162 RepID=C5HIW2_9HEMI|nr:NADH dehydrogenase subunit 6 [Ochterus marginatus]